MRHTALSPAAVGLIVKRAVIKAAIAEGITRSAAKAMARNFAGHSLRAGHATSAEQLLAQGDELGRTSAGDRGVELADDEAQA